MDLRSVDVRDLPSEVSAEIAHFEGESERFRQGELTWEQFSAYRTMRGIYGQRQKDRYMVRVKVPSGLLSAEQMEMLAHIAEAYSRGFAYVTTRQDIQVHNILLEKVPTIMALLASVGLTAREACGNTVRNVTCDYLAGLCQDEIFDVTPYALAVTQHFLRHSLVQKLPRKFKIAFSSCRHDHGLTPIQDVGAQAVLRNGHRGFRLLVGGGLGAAPRLADPFADFVPEEELIRTCEAIIRVFEREGGFPNLLRKNRNKARLKFLLWKVGIEEFRRLVAEDLSQMPPAESDVYTRPDLSLTEGPPEHPQPPTPAQPRLGYEVWRRLNVYPQKQEGYHLAQVLLPMGKVTVEQLQDLAQIARRFAGGRSRTTPGQNLVLRWVREADLAALHAALLETGLAQPGAETILDPVACPGTDTCRTGITNAKALGRAVVHELSQDGYLEDPLARSIRIMIDGCPNACGQHWIGDIGLCGSTLHVEGRLIPTYDLMVGSGPGETGSFLAQRVMRIGAKRAPEAVIELLRYYREARQGAEPFRAFVGRVGPGAIREALGLYDALPAFHEDPMAYVDWETQKLFSLDERGEGECAV